MMPVRQQIATFNATNTVTILLDRYVGPNGRPLTLRELAATFAISIREVLDAFSMPENHDFARAIYNQLYDAGAADLYFETEDVPGLADLEEQLDVESAREFVYEWVGQCYERGFVFDELEVPPIQLELPMSPELVALISRMYGRGSRPDRIIQFAKIDYPRQEVERLRERTQALREATKAAERRMEPHAATMIALDKIATACDLQRRHWWHESQHGRATEAEYRENAKLLDAVIAASRELSDRVIAEVPPDPHELDVARSVLMFFDPDQRRELADFMVDFSEYPRLFEPSDISAFIEVLEDAVEAMTMSARCEEFTRDHLLPFFDLTAMSLGTQFEEGFRSASGELAMECNERWRQPLVAMREVIGEPRGRSLLQTMALFMKAERTARNIVASALNPFFIKFTMSVLFRSSRGATWKTYSDLGVFLLRQLAVNFTVVRGPGLELTNAKAGTFVKLMKNLETLSRTKDPTTISHATKAIQDLRIGSSFTRGRLAIGLNFIGYSLAFMSACGGAPAIDAGPIAHMKFLASVSSGLAGIAQQHFRYHELRAFIAGRNSTDLTNLVRRFGAATNFLSAIASSLSAVEKFKKGKTWAGAIECGAAVGSGAIGVGQILEIIAVSGSRVGMVSGFGYIVSAAAIVALIAYEVYYDGVEPMVDGLEGFVAASPTAKIHGHVFRDAIADARSCMTSFRERAGQRGEDPYVGPPTVWGSYALGFSIQEIVMIFGSSNVYVKTVLAGAKEGVST